EGYFEQYEAQATARPGQIAEPAAGYSVGDGRAARPEDDLISMRALSHALRVDSTVLRRLIERGQLQPERSGPGARGGAFFRRDRIEAIRAQLIGRALPANPEEWRREFLDFARSRNMSKSYKPVLLKALLALVDSSGAAHIDALAAEFRAFYVARRRAGLPVEFGPPDLSDPAAVSDARLRRLIVE